MTFIQKIALYIATILMLLPTVSMATVAHTQSSIAAKDDEIPDSLKNDPKFLACKKNATPIPGQGALGVCERTEHDLGQYDDAIIYDSSEQILLPMSQSSHEWKKIAESLDKKAPFGILKYSVEKKLGGHFYHVIFDYNNPATVNDVE